MGIINNKDSQISSLSSDLSDYKNQLEALNASIDQVQDYINDFESNFQLDQNIDIEVKNGVWKQTKQELNANQYAEFYQTSNVSSSFVWVLTIIHFLHLIFSISGISVVAYRTQKGYYNDVYSKQLTKKDDKI